MKHNSPRRRWPRSLPAWMVSLAVHALLVICLVLGFDQSGRGNRAGSSPQSLTLIASFDQEGGAELQQMEAIVVAPALNNTSVQPTVAQTEADGPEQLESPTTVDEEPQPDDGKLESNMPEDTEQVRIASATEEGPAVPLPLPESPVARRSPTSNWKSRLAALTAGIPSGGEARPGGAAGNAPGNAPGGDAHPGSVDGTSFFQVQARGSLFCYVVDCSSSMEEDDAIGVARRELLASLDRLDASRQFQILFYDAEPRPLTQGKQQTFFATRENRKLARQFVLGQQPSGGTRHLPALLTALRSNADVIYFLTDGATPELSARDLNELRTLNRQRRPIHVIEFGRGAKLGTNWLDDLARDHHGTCNYRDVAQQQ